MGKIIAFSWQKHIDINSVRYTNKGRVLITKAKTDKFIKKHIDKRRILVLYFFRIENRKEIKVYDTLRRALFRNNPHGS